MKDYVYKNFLSLALVALIVILVFKTCKEEDSSSNKPTIIIHKDTSWVIAQGNNVITKPTIINRYYDTSNNDIIIPSDSLAIKRYILELRRELLSINVYNDSLKIDSLGYVNVIDSIQNNLIKNRKYSYNLKYPKIITTITIKEPYIPKTQIYVGGEVFGNKLSPINGLNAGLLLKSKSDNIYSIKLGVQTINSTIQPNIGIGLYWKIHFKK